MHLKPRRSGTAGSSVQLRFAKARAGNSTSLGQLLEGCRSYLLLVARQQTDRRIQVKSAPSDLVQETFIEARRQFADFNGNDNEQLAAWLRQILRFKVADSVRRYRKTAKRAVDREVPLTGVDSRPGAEELLIAPESRPARRHERADREALLHALARLPEHYRQIVKLRQWEGRRFDEIGVLMQRSPAAAQRLWARAIRRLRQEFERDERS